MSSYEALKALQIIVFVAFFYVAVWSLGKD